MRIAVTGIAGQVVTALREQAASIADVEVVSLGRPELDLLDVASIGPVLIASNADIIVSAAAYTAVDKAEGEPDAAFAINRDAPAAIAAAAAAMGVPLIHLSTDYVFDGGKPSPYVEDDETGPLGVYGKSKLGGEEGIREAYANHVILRTAWVYSPFGNNFLKTMLRLAGDRPRIRVVADQRGTPTSALDIADAIFVIARNLLDNPADARLRGTFHLVGGGEASWAEFAREIFARSAELGGPSATVEAIETSQYPTPAPRPANSRLATEKLALVHGIHMPDWRLSTAETIKFINAARS
jgi:dTDP-4-dehydrorhamnose reductase